REGRGRIRVGRELVEFDPGGVGCVAVKPRESGASDIRVRGLAGPVGRLLATVDPDLEVHGAAGDPEAEPLLGCARRVVDPDAANVRVDGPAPFAEELDVAGAVETHPVEGGRTRGQAQHGSRLIRGSGD